MLQTVQNFACRIVSGRRKYDHVSSILKELRWLPVKEHLYNRDAVMSFKNWFVLSVCISNYGCTREVWRAREKRKAKSRIPKNLLGTL